MNCIGKGEGIKIILKLSNGAEVRGYCLTSELSLAWCKMKGVHECQVPLSHEVMLIFHAMHPAPVYLGSNIVICGNECSGGMEREQMRARDRERVVYGSVLHAFTFDLPIITIGFTFNDSVAKPIS